VQILSLYYATAVRGRQKVKLLLKGELFYITCHVRNWGCRYV